MPKPEASGTHLLEKAFRRRSDSLGRGTFWMSAKQFLTVKFESKSEKGTTFVISSPI